MPATAVLAYSHRTFRSAEVGAPHAALTRAAARWRTRPARYFARASRPGRLRSLTALESSCFGESCIVSGSLVGILGSSAVLSREQVSPTFAMDDLTRRGFAGRIKISAGQWRQQAKYRSPVRSPCGGLLLLPGHRQEVTRKGTG